MQNNHWVEQVKQRWAKRDRTPSDVLLDQLRADGLIDDKGRVTGHVHRWNADLAVVETTRPDRRSKKIAVFRCFKPVFGIPGGEIRDVPRDAVVQHLKEGKKIITAHWDDRLKMWREGAALHLSPKGWIRTDQDDAMADDVGSLREIQNDAPHEK